MKPFIELNFMPETLASGGKTVFSYEGNVTPRNDYQRWSNLIHRLGIHWIERYGTEEVRSWFFEVWNEPNLHHFWTGTQEDYFKPYRNTVEAIKSVDSSLKVGGPATVANEWIREFVDLCEQNNVPLDFVSTHHCPTDAFGEPGDDTETQLAKSRRSVLREQAQKANELARGRPLYYTEWSSSSNPRDPLRDEPYFALIPGLLTSLAALGIVCQMLGALFLVHFPLGHPFVAAGGGPSYSSSTRRCRFY